jgi:hypothetical protein
MDSHKPDKVEQDPSFKIDSIEEYKEVQDIKLKHWVITTVVKVGVVLLLAFGAGMIYFMIKNPDQANLLTSAFESVIKVVTTIIEAN